MPGNDGAGEARLELGVPLGQKRARASRLVRAVTVSLRLTWRASPGGFIAAAVLQLVGALSTTGLIVVGKLAIDAVVAVPGGGGLQPRLVEAIVLLAVLSALGSSAGALQAQQQRLLGEQVSVVAWRSILDVTGRVELETFESPRFYDHLRRVEDNALTQPTTVTAALFGLLGGVVGVVGLLAALLTIAPLIVPVLLLAGIPTLLISRRASRLEFDFVARITAAYRARHYLREVLTGREEAKEIRAFGAERALRGRHDERSVGLISQIVRHVKVRQAYALASVATTAVGLVLALGLLIWLLALGRITVADAGATILAIRLLSSSLDTVLQSVGGLFESGVFLDDLAGFLALAGEMPPATGGPPRPLRAEVVVDQVSYRYPGSSSDVLQDVSLSVRRGEVIAIVGENGSGKTTLAKLMAGLYSPSGGTIRWDGVDTADIEPTELRRGVAVIFQDFVRYQLTALENIGLGDPDDSQDLPAAEAAAEQAGAAEFLSRLPNGYETVLSKEYEEGTDLSLGQWQRVALARALRRDAPLVILDEPSAALDPRAEQALFSDIRGTLRGRSAVLISHRFSTVRSADRIYVMRDGAVAEAGSHDELMRHDGLYAELFTLQASGYVS